MIEDYRVESMTKSKKEEDKKEDIEEKKEEHNPKPSKKRVKKKVEKKIEAHEEEEKKEESEEKTEEDSEEEGNKEKIEEKTEEDSEETKAHKVRKHKKDKKRLGKIITTVVVLIIIIAVILLVANIGKFFPKKEVAKEKDVAAVVNGEIITNEELDKQYAVLPAQYKLAFTREAFLDQMIDERLLLQEAEKNNIVVDDKRIDQIIESILLQNKLSLEEFEDRLELQGISLDYIKNYYRNQIIISDLLNKTVFSKTEATLPERIRASHILVNNSEDAERIKKELDEGADFAKIAEEKSIDLSSKLRGGDLGYFIKGQMVEEFEEAAFDLDIGEISEVVKTDFGYHVIKLTDKKPEETKYLSDVRIDEQRLVAEDMSSTITGYLEGLRSKAVITKGEERKEEAEEAVEKVEKEEPIEIETSKIKTFKPTGDSICSEDEKPIIRLFSTTKCPHCEWIKDTFDKTAKEYGDDIIAYHWELDIGDNTLTPELEKAIPKSELEIFKKYNTRSSVPTFVFGCKYYRIGNAYEASGGLAAEEAEFKAVIEELLSEN